MSLQAGHVRVITKSVDWSKYLNNAVHGTIRTASTTHAAAPKNSVQKTICCNSTSNAPDDGRMCPKHVELRMH